MGMTPKQICAQQKSYSSSLISYFSSKIVIRRIYSVYLFFQSVPSVWICGKNMFSNSTKPELQLVLVVK